MTWLKRLLAGKPERQEMITLSYPRQDLRVDVKEAGEKDDDSTEDFPRGERGGVKMMLVAPNINFVRGNPGAELRIKVFEELGFEFGIRNYGHAEVVSVIDPVSVELCSIEELIELQRRIGLPLKLEDGVLEVMA